MGELIASTYQIMEKLGEGGGGAVYKGQHLRLHIPVAIKKATPMEKANIWHAKDRLSREVKTLTQLSHSYIPKLYDYVIQKRAQDQSESNTDEDDQDKYDVYTIIDFIEGVSLDKLLEQGVRFEQKQVIRWAKQLLEALCYLHSRPPRGILHADIKPANIMLTPQNEIRLIDFNIALFLKPDGAVRVGYSEGYASPEHYGIDYSDLGMTRTDGAAGTQIPRNPAQTVLPTNYRSVDTSKGVLLDVRSDIYSLGASLYHLLTGERPDIDATRVRPVSEWENISPSVAKIIEKAMNPNPNLRFQKASQMLEAFRRLREDDLRTIHHRRRRMIVATFCTFAFLAGGLTTFTGLKQMEREQNAYKLAEYSSDSLRRGDVDQALSFALEALPENRGLLDPPYTAQARRALANALGVYNLADGYRSHKRISLTSVTSDGAVRPIKAKLSPDGSLAAVLVNELENWWIQVYDTDSGKSITVLEAEQSPTSDFIFTDNMRLLYAGKEGFTCYDLNTGKNVWTTGRSVTNITLSADGSRAATVCRDETQAVLWNALTGEFLREVDFHGRHLRFLPGDTLVDPKDSLFALDAAGQWLAVSFSDSSATLYHMDDWREESIFDTGMIDCTHFEGGFCGSFFSLTASGGSTSYFLLVDLLNMKVANSSENPRDFHIQIDESGIYLARPSLDVISKINPYAQTEDEILERRLCSVDSGIESFSKTGENVLVFCKDGSRLMFDGNARQIAQLDNSAPIDSAAFAGDILLLVNRDTSALFIQKWEEHQNSDEVLFRYDPSIYHLEANVHTNGKSAMLFWRNQFTIIDQAGVASAPFEIADADRMRDQQYRRAGKINRLGRTADQDYLEIWYYDGLVRAYSAIDGSVLFEEQGPLPDELGMSRQRNEEIMETADFRVVSHVNATPMVYDRADNSLLGTLDGDGILMYIYQIGDCFAAQYMKADGQSKFGQLLNRNCEVLADLPNLTDVLPDNTLVFDDTHGNLRQSRVYSIEELINLGRQEKEADE